MKTTCPDLAKAKAIGRLANMLTTAYTNGLKLDTAGAHALASQFHAQASGCADALHALGVSGQVTSALYNDTKAGRHSRTAISDVNLAKDLGEA